MAATLLRRSPNPDPCAPADPCASSPVFRNPSRSDRCYGFPPGANSAGQPPVWTNTTSLPNRPSAARPSRPGAVPCRSTCDRAATRRGGPPSGSRRHPRRWARRSPRRSTGCRPRRPRGRRSPSSRIRVSVSLASPAMSGRPMFTPLATPIAMTSGTSRPMCAAAARPASRPAWVPPLDDVNDHVARPDPGGIELVEQLDERRGVAERTDGGAPPDRNRIRAQRPRRRDCSVSASRADLQLAPVALGGAGEVQLGAEQHRQQLVAGDRRRAGRRTARGATSSPSRAPAAAVIRQWFDCAAPTVTRAPAPAASASPQRNSSLRALLPPPPSPVRSSRLTHSLAPPSRVGPASSGVGSVASGARSR